MVMEEMDEPRDTMVLDRGDYRNRGEKVEPGVPAALSPFPQDAPPTRLGLARWLVGPDHPLTARVTVNRFWQMYHGNGFVKSAENFGSQGDQPSHPELLDWLSTEFVGSGWDVKGLQRLLVTSATYRQSSRVTPELLERDPENRLLARASRFRLPAELVRDNALRASGLLVNTIGGPSVYPLPAPRVVEGDGLRREVHGPSLCPRQGSQTSSAAGSTLSGSGPFPRRHWPRLTHPTGKPAPCGGRGPTLRCKR